MTASEEFDLAGKSVWVAGHRGLVGSAVLRRLAQEPVGRVITATSAEVDLRRQDQTERFLLDQKPDVSILAAARVGGIQANRSMQADFLYENLMISANALEACRRAGVQKVAVLGSSCIYPRESPQPIVEEYLLSGHLETTNEGYAVAKIAALEMGKMYRRQYGLDVISLMPTNLYGPGDNYDLETSHVLPALIRKIHEAKRDDVGSVVLWGTGNPTREFLYVDDAADAVEFSLRRYSGEQHLNVGTGKEISILDLASLIARVVGWNGEFELDTSMPDGTMRKLLDVSKLDSLGWRASVKLADGIDRTYAQYLETVG